MSLEGHRSEVTRHACVMHQVARRHLGLALRRALLRPFGPATRGRRYVSLVGVQQEASFFFTLEIIFTVIFTMELLFNLFGSWWKPFIAEAWNWCVSACDVSCHVLGERSVSVRGGA